MYHVTMADIAHDGTIVDEDERRTIYLTPAHPLSFHENQWVYHRVPSVTEWQQDLALQRQQHRAQQSDHISFLFPQNVMLEGALLDTIKAHDFEVGYLELYAIESKAWDSYQIPDDLKIQWVDETNIEDYISVYSHFSLPFGKDYMKEMNAAIRQNYLKDSRARVIAYQHQLPVGVVDLIMTEHTVEIDGFGVIESHQHQGIGSAIQTFAARAAGTRPLILVADGEDSAKEMYVKQGYVYLGYCYQILKESLT
ncbi:GNAT family N-acetyltransferase [Staphylococcus auricularis]|nr:GNAT family N-acetyltransferase [Staphylococcus auricularis]MEB6570112.1 GNAT family N-acetyltransferase [Staphylococcus auricularis]